MSEEYKFDEDKAIDFIRAFVGKEVSEKYDDDEILYVIDIIWDWYEKKGYLSLNENVTEEELLNVDQLVDYVKKEIANDREIMMDPADIPLIVKGELEYEESLEDFV